MEGTELVLQKSQVISDSGTNGGRQSFTQVSSNVLNNMFPNVTQAERTSGVTRYRKFFFRNKNASLETAVNSRIWISQKSLGGDYFRLKAGTNSDIQSAADDYTNWMGTGHLTQPFATDATSMTALFDAATGVYNSSRIRICDSSGGEEFLTVKASNGVSWNGNTATIVTTTGARSTYPASENSLISGVVDLGNAVASTSDWSETSASGIYDESGYPVVVNNVGTVADTWTLIFTGTTTFTVSGTNTGSVGSGSTAADFQPVNANIGDGSYYFEIDASGWSGVFALGDTITFTTTHSSFGLWLKEVVPSSTAARTSNTMSLKLYAEGS